MGERRPGSLDDVNRSGFPFQIAIEHFIKARKTEPPWRVVASEVPWSGGYADLVIRYGRVIAVIECKRCHDQTWTFLVEDSSEPQVTAGRALYHRQWYGREILDREFLRQVIDVDIDWVEPSFESRYCVVAPRKDNPIRELEGIASELVAACHDLADGPGRHHETEIELTVPVLVTTASLSICRYKIGSIDLKSGTIADGRIEPIDMIRFRKPLSTDLESIEGRTPAALGLGPRAARQERTVFVVTPDGLERFLFGARRVLAQDPYDPQFASMT